MVGFRPANKSVPPQGSVAPAAPAAPAPIQHPTPPATPAYDVSHLHAMDVSHYEPNIDWKQAKAAGFSVAMSKCTDGTAYVDPTFRSDRDGAAEVGMAYMPYHFFRFEQNPVTQAGHFAQTLGAVKPGELAPCLDLEWDNTTTTYANGKELDEEGATRALAFLHALENLVGMTPFVYTSPGFFPGKCSPTTAAQFARYPLWIAHYNVAAPRIPSPWKTFTFWQYTDKEEVPGSGKIDASWFNGGAAELARLVKS